MNFAISTDAIIAISTPEGMGAIALIRLSGKNVINIVDEVFESKTKKKLNNQKSHTVHFGYIKADKKKIIDEVLVTIFKTPNSYTGEDLVEISCHGSVYIQHKIITLFTHKNVRVARPGEFTLRAFLNKKIDLIQAEAVADLIASENEMSHQIAIRQMRGEFRDEINVLKEKFINFASLIELELDFSEEDVEFADRRELKEILEKITNNLKQLIESFAFGNVIKKGIAVTIVGAPNVGKSTLLNTLLKEEKAIISEIAGTTRDVIEDKITLNGIDFRFIDTAGIRNASNEIEKIGIQKTFQKIQNANVILYLIDALEFQKNSLNPKKELKKIIKKNETAIIFIVFNKIDLVEKTLPQKLEKTICLSISAKEKKGIENLKKQLTEHFSINYSSQNIITNLRHYEVLKKIVQHIDKVKKGLEENIYSELLVIDIKQALKHLGEISGEITTDDLLGNIFSNFCIGK